MATKWGIVTAGKISHDFTTAIQLLPKDEHQVVAVAARELSNAQTFAKRFHVPAAYGSYLELAQDPNVEIAYIGSIHPMHYELTLLMLNHGKHVLCEKPLAMSERQARAMVELAKEKGLFLLEGIWSRFFPVYDQLRADLKANAYGNVQFLSINFGALLWNKAPRVMENVHGGGSLFTLGVYPIQLALLIFNEEPERIEADAVIAQPNNVDKFCAVTMHFSGDRVAQFNLHLDSFFDNKALIFCEKGTVEIPDFWAPKQLVTPEQSFEFPTPEPESGKPFNLPHSVGFVYQIQGVRKALLHGEKESELFPHSETMRMAKILDEIRKKIGLVYDADNEK